MSTHLQVRLHDGFVTAARLVARLHALGATVDEVHTSRDLMCVHLASPVDERRVRTVLDRSPDAVVKREVGTQGAPCRPASPRSATGRTTYVVCTKPKPNTRPGAGNGRGSSPDERGRLSPSEVRKRCHTPPLGQMKASYRSQRLPALR